MDVTHPTATEAEGKLYIEMLFAKIQDEGTVVNVNLQACQDVLWEVSLSPVALKSKNKREY